MNASRHREIACAIMIDTSGRFLLLQRDDVVGILHPGWAYSAATAMHPWRTGSSASKRLAERAA